MAEISLNDQFNELIQTTLYKDQDESAKNQDFFQNNNAIEKKDTCSTLHNDKSKNKKLLA